ncbi:MAG: class I SAM-dependent methyltransferase [bacterium]|nr:class I SAM-dependent methyltransferase [bacterium]
MKNLESSFAENQKNKLGEGDFETGPLKSLPDFIDFSQRKEPEKNQKESDISDLERKYKLSRSEAKTLYYYTYNFDLNPRDLFGKDIVDIGSGFGEFKNALEKIASANSVNTSILNFDRFNDGRFKNTDVVGNAESLPFKDESFDVVLAHCSTPIMQATSQEYEAISKIIKEMFRIAKNGGVIKIHPIALVPRQKALQQFKKDYLRMGSIVLEELGKIHKINKDIKIKIIETSDNDEDESRGIYWSLELRK